jgi:glutaminyl-peptide cyclotransferase
VLAVALVGCSAAQARPPFSQGRAWSHLERQVAFGPRVPNTGGHVTCRDYLVETLRPLADRVERQDFSFRLNGKTLRMSNIIARWDGRSRENGVLLCAHWDTRPTADEDPNPALRGKPILGANDGASGVAVLLEAARLFQRNPPPVPVMLVLFDGEDYGPGIDRMFLGSRHFAANLPPDVPRRGILLDMVGDRDLVIPQEGYSRRGAPEVLRQVYRTAHRLGYRRHFPARPGPSIQDDHLPLLAQGLRVIDLIDFSYGPRHGWWHTHKDTPDKCLPRSLRVVGEVVTAWVYAR